MQEALSPPLSDNHYQIPKDDEGDNSDENKVVSEKVYLLRILFEHSNRALSIQLNDYT